MFVVEQFVTLILASIMLEVCETFFHLDFNQQEKIGMLLHNVR